MTNHPFAGRFTEAQAANIPVFGKITVNAALVSVEQHTQPELDGHNVWQNLVVPKIIDSWHVGAWTPDTLKPSDFRPIKALILEQINTIGWLGKPIEDFWQAYFFRYVADKLRVLMAAGAVPAVPIILKTTPGFLQVYQGDYAVMLQDGRASWLYLALSEPQLDSTAIYPDLWSIYQWATWDDFKYSYMPDGYFERTLLFEFAAGKQHLSFITGNNLAYLYKGFAGAAEFTEFFGGETQPPPPIIEPTIEELKAKLAEWQAWYASAPI